MPATVKAYASPTCVLLAFDWPEGVYHSDFLGFAIRRDPGFGKDGKPQYLFNKLDFVPIKKGAKPKGSDQAPIQKFNWWDGGIDSKDRGKTFTYTVIPVTGSGAGDLSLNEAQAGYLAVRVPHVFTGPVATYFNRAVVSSQSFRAMVDAKKSLEAQMDWLANGLERAVPDILHDSDSFDCAIYHLTDKRWVIPAFNAFKGQGTLVYFDKKDDHASSKGAAEIKNKAIARKKRTKISALMHDKFIVSHLGAAPKAVLMGSANFTPEAQTVQANLLHVFHSPQLATLYAARAKLLAQDKSTGETAKGAGWTSITDIAGADVRAMLLPEPGKGRLYLDTVTQAVTNAKSSVLFCMYTASDQALMDAIFAVGDSDNRLIYGLLNSISDPDKPTRKGTKPKLPQVAVEIFHRSRTQKDTLQYDSFTARDTPAGFLPELRAIDTSKYAAGASGPPMPIHIHHKFIVIDGDTPRPTIYTGSANFSGNSEHHNDENVLEITGSKPVADIYVAEFLRLYNHYRARALWNQDTARTDKSLVLADSRDKWAKGAYRAGSKEFLARTRFL